MCVCVLGSTQSLAESGRSESRSTLKSPREETAEISQLRKVRTVNVLFTFLCSRFTYALVASLAQLFPVQFQHDK